jgi:hypothetical protein
MIEERSIKSNPEWTREKRLEEVAKKTRSLFAIVAKKQGEEKKKPVGAPKGVLPGGSGGRTGAPQGGKAELSEEAQELMELWNTKT